MQKCLKITISVIFVHFGEYENSLEKHWDDIISYLVLKICYEMQKCLKMTMKQSVSSFIRKRGWGVGLKTSFQIFSKFSTSFARSTEKNLRWWFLSWVQKSTRKFLKKSLKLTSSDHYPIFSRAMKSVWKCWNPIKCFTEVGFFCIFFLRGKFEMVLLHPHS